MIPRLRYNEQEDVLHVDVDRPFRTFPGMEEPEGVRNEGIHHHMEIDPPDPFERPDQEGVGPGCEVRQGGPLRRAAPRSRGFPSRSGRPIRLRGQWHSGSAVHPV